MDLLRKCRWLKLKLRFGRKFDVPIKGTFIGKIGLSIGNNGKLQLAPGFSCRDNVSINISSGTIMIGNETFINEGCKLNARKGITIGKRCLIGQNVLMYDHDHDYRDLANMRDNFRCDDIIIEDDVWIGSNVTILRGTRIGARCVIGAGTIVKGRIPADSLVYAQREIEIKPIARGNVK